MSVGKAPTQRVASRRPAENESPGKSFLKRFGAHSSCSSFIFSEDSGAHQLENAKHPFVSNRWKIVEEFTHTVSSLKIVEQTGTRVPVKHGVPLIFSRSTSIRSLMFMIPSQTTKDAWQSYQTTVDRRTSNPPQKSARTAVFRDSSVL